MSRSSGIVTIHLSFLTGLLMSMLPNATNAVTTSRFGRASSIVILAERYFVHHASPNKDVFHPPHMHHIMSVLIALHIAISFHETNLAHLKFVSKNKNKKHPYSLSLSRQKIIDFSSDFEVFL